MYEVTIFTASTHYSFVEEDEGAQFLLQFWKDFSNDKPRKKRSHCYVSYSKSGSYRMYNLNQIVMIDAQRKSQ